MRRVQRQQTGFSTFYFVKILLTNNTLAKPAGSERSVAEAASEMKGRGHAVAVFSVQQGEVADSLRAQGILVVDHPAAMPWEPDVIHGHHEWETTCAALSWPRAALLSFCRGAESWQEAPCRARWVYRWIAVDGPCLRRLRDEEGIPQDRIVCIPNGVDLHRFPPRTNDLPLVPRKALVFSNYANHDEDNYLAQVQEACASLDIECQAVGAGVQQMVSAPETILSQYDIVFAKGRAALEALASGCAVIVCDLRGLGPMVTTENFVHLRYEHFGFSLMQDRNSVEEIKKRLGQYSAADAMEVSSIVRKNCRLRETVDALEKLYDEAIQNLAAPTVDDLADLASAFLVDKTIAYKAGRTLKDEWAAQSPRLPPDSPEKANLEHDRLLHYYRKAVAAQSPSRESPGRSENVKTEKAERRTPKWRRVLNKWLTPSGNSNHQNSLKSG